MNKFLNTVILGACLVASTSAYSNDVGPLVGISEIHAQRALLETREMVFSELAKNIQAPIMVNSARSIKRNLPGSYEFTSVSQQESSMQYAARQDGLLINELMIN